MAFRSALIAIALAAPPSAAAFAAPSPPSPNEHLAIVPPPGTTMTRSDATRRGGGGEHFVAWESADKGRRRVKIVTLPGRSRPDAPAAMVRALLPCANPCPGQRMGQIDHRPFAARPAARSRAYVPSYGAGGRPLTVFAFSVAGERDLHTILISISGPLSPADKAFAEAVLRSVTWCPAGSRDRICRANRD